MLFTLVVGAFLAAAGAIITNFRKMLQVTFFGSKNAGACHFEPFKDIASVTGKVVLVTDGAGGLGR